MAVVDLEIQWRHLGRISHWTWQLLSSIFVFSNVWNLYSIISMAFHRFFQRWNGRIRWATLHVKPQQTTTQTCAMVKTVAHIGGWSSVDYIMEIHITSYPLYPIVRILFMVCMTIPRILYHALTMVHMDTHGLSHLSLYFVRFGYGKRWVCPKFFGHCQMESGYSKGLDISWLRSIFGCSNHVFKDRKKPRKYICKHCTWWISHQLEIFGGLSFLCSTVSIARSD